MADVVEEFHKKWWQEIYKRVFGGVVFIEDSFAECLHWQGGLINLLNVGAKSIKCLSPFENGNVNQRKVIFIAKGTSTNIDTIQEILINSHFINCILIIAADSNVLQSESNLSYAGIEDAISKIMPIKPCVVEVMYAPVFAISVANGIFTTPIFSKLYPKFGLHLFPSQSSTLDLHSLSLDDKNEVRRLATSFNSLLSYMDVKDDIFYMGPFSSILAGVLEHLPEAIQRRKNASSQASIIFIDRTVDLGAVTSHGSGSLLDKMMNLLPRFPGHSTDLAVDISSLCESDMVTVTDDIHLSPGCIVHPKDENCKQIFDHLVNKPQTEAMFGLYNKLSKITGASPSNLPSRVTAQNLEKLVSTFKGNHENIKANAGLLQQALAIIQTLKSPNVQQTDLLLCLEQQILQSITTSRDSTSVLSQISVIIKSWKQRGLSIERILSLLVHIYSLAGGYITFSEAQEKNLYDSLCIALFEDTNFEVLNCEDIDDVHSPEGASTFARMTITKLREISKTRDSFSRYKSVIKIVDKISPSEYRGVLQQLVCDLVDIKRPEIPDLKCRTSGLKDLLKSGLSILMSSTTKNPQNISKHPFDNPTVIIFVVGGVTIEECFKMHRDIMISGTDINVIIGSTSFVNPVEAMRQALFLN